MNPFFSETRTVSKAFVLLVSALICFYGAPPTLADSSLERQLKSGKKQIFFSGKESDDVKIRKGVSVVGESPATAFINGEVTMEDGSSLSNVTVNANVIGITVAKGASVILSNVTVRGASDSGIFAHSGGGTLTVKNSRIMKNRKGFYILSGKNIVLVNNDIVENKEEGLDIRSGVTGSISGNRASNNGEGGSEIIVNGASLSITGNFFTQNKASGLSLQFYSGSASSGNVRVSSNTFSANGDYGVTCGAPSGGDRPAGFFQNSVRLAGNVFGGGNNAGNISHICGVGNAQVQADAPKENGGAISQRIDSKPVEPAGPAAVVPAKDAAAAPAITEKNPTVLSAEDSNDAAMTLEKLMMPWKSGDQKCTPIISGKQVSYWTVF